MTEVYFDGRLVALEQSGLYERAFLESCLEWLRKDHCEAVRDSRFVVINGYERAPLDLDRIDERSIVFVFDENSRSYEAVARRARLVLQAYVADSDCPAANHHSFPLGYAQAVGSDRLRPITERPTNVFFSGNLHRGRAGFYRWLSRIPAPFPLLARIQAVLKLDFDRRFPSSTIRFTSGFGAGIPPDRYAEAIAGSKILLCPGGSIAVESFRLYEGMMAGCVIITERLPERAFFAGSPVIEIDRWRDAEPHIARLLADPAALSDLSRRTLDWYQGAVSPEACARRIAGLLAD